MSAHYEGIENEKIEEGASLDSTMNSLVFYDYNVINCAEKMFTELRYKQSCSHFSYDEDNEDEDNTIPDPPTIMQIDNGNNEITKIIIQKCVFCLEKDTIYAFRQCDHHCVCKSFCRNKGDLNVLNCVVCKN